jgi:hypothetical protein
MLAKNRVELHSKRLHAIATEPRGLASRGSHKRDLDLTPAKDHAMSEQIEPANPIKRGLEATASKASKRKRKEEKKKEKKEKKEKTESAPSSQPPSAPPPLPSPSSPSPPSPSLSLHGLIKIHPCLSGEQCAHIIKLCEEEKDSTWSARGDYAQSTVTRSFTLLSLFTLLIKLIRPKIRLQRKGLPFYKVIQYTAKSNSPRL